MSARQIRHSVIVEIDDRDVVAIGRRLRFPHGMFAELAAVVLEHDPTAWVWCAGHDIKITVSIEIDQLCVPIAAAVLAAADPDRFVRKLGMVRGKFLRNNYEYAAS